MSSQLARYGAALAMIAGGILVASAPGCGREEYRCDTTGCFDCDGYGCRPVTPPTPAPCGFAGDPTCKNGTVCTDIGCLSPCKADAECAKGFVCRAGLCSHPSGKDPSKKICTLASECPTGSSCIDGACVATPPCTGAGCTCKYSSDCGEGRICVDGACKTSCGPGAPACASGLTCSDKGTCEPGSIPACSAAPGGASCKSGERCVDGRCVSGCAADEECKGADGKADPTLRCIGGACVPDTRTDPKCSGDTQCTAGSQKCLDGFCRYLCSTDDACKAIDSRIGACSKTEGICRAPSEIEAKCTSKNDCGDKSCVDGQCK